MADAAFAFLDFVGVEVAAVFHVQLRQIENISRRIVHADAGEGAIAGASEDVDLRILFFKAGKNYFDVLNFKTEVIEACLAAWRPRVEIQSDVTVADDHGPTSAL